MAYCVLLGLVELVLQLSYKTCIRQVLSSILSHNTEYSEGGFSWVKVSLFMQMAAKYFNEAKTESFQIFSNSSLHSKR
jgi:hypothetical protein